MTFSITFLIFASINKSRTSGAGNKNDNPNPTENNKEHIYHG